MKKIVLTAIALAAATPALASDQLARSLGVEPGQFTASELAVLKAHSTEQGNEARVNLDSVQVFSTQGVHSPSALAQFLRHDRETNEGGLAN